MAYRHHGPPAIKVVDVDAGPTIAQLGRRIAEILASLPPTVDANDPAVLELEDLTQQIARLQAQMPSPPEREAP